MEPVRDDGWTSSLLLCHLWVTSVCSWPKTWPLPQTPDRHLPHPHLKSTELTRHWNERLSCWNRQFFFLSRWRRNEDFSVGTPPVPEGQREIPMDPQYLGRGHSLCVLESSPMELTAINASFEVSLVFLLRHLITHPWKGLLVFQPSPYIALKHNKGWF